MAAPRRGNTGCGTYFITASTFQRSNLFQSERMARLFVEVLLGYRGQGKYLLHEFVLMPDHFHLLITPTLTLERALQLIRGGFSYRARKGLGFGGALPNNSDSPNKHVIPMRPWREGSYVSLKPPMP